MKKIFTALHRSLSARLSFAVILFVAVIFVGAFSIMFSEARDIIREEAWGKATQTLEGTVLHIDNTLRRVEVASDNLLRVIERNLDKPDSMFSISKQVLVNNTELTGCSISFEPYFFEDQGKYFSIYSTNEDGHIETEQEGSDDYDYFMMTWYQEPIRKGKACWVDPFHDYTPGTSYDMMIASYCKPLIDAKGRTIGVISTDLSQRKLSQILLKERLYPNAYFIISGESGHLIATSNDQALPDDLNRSDCLVVSLTLPNTNWELS